MRSIGVSSEELFELYVHDAGHPFSGWDFSHIRTRLVTEPMMWSYHSVVLPLVRSSARLLDMGTGGGEFLYSLAPLPGTTCATEAYEPNVPVACERLEPLGVQVDQISEGEPLPYEDDFFDLIINRHESFSVPEVYRILEPGGFFVTQQVGGRNDIELNRLLGAPIEVSTEEWGDWDIDWGLGTQSKELEEGGFNVLEGMECFPVSRFFDIGAVVYYLKAIPWQIPDFTVERYREALRALHETILEEGYVDVASHYFMRVSKKP